MIIHIPADNSSTIYSSTSSLNTGADEVLELVKDGERNGEIGLYDANPSRILFSFPTQLIRSFSSSSNEYDLKLWLTDPTYIPNTASFQVFPVSESWFPGTGRRFNTPATEHGVNWKTRDGETPWMVSESSPTFFADFSTASFSSIAGGANWYHIESGTFELSSFSSGTVTDVTSIVDKWVSGTYYPDHGLVCKFSGSTEFDLTNRGHFKFFSARTNTIWNPVIAVKYSDWTFTGTLAQASYDCVAKLLIPHTVLPNSTTLIQMLVKDATYVPTLTNLDNKFVLPEDSWWELQDYASEDPLIHGDRIYTKLSRNSSGNFFKLNTFGLARNRRYRIVIYSEFVEGLKKFYDYIYIA